MRTEKATDQKRKRNEDLVGKKFGKLTVEKVIPCDDDRGKSRAYCKCDCGNYKMVRIGDLKIGSVKSCGCAARTRSGTYSIGKLSTVEEGDKFYALTVEEILPPNKSKEQTGSYRALCKCDCGKTTIIPVGSLRFRKSCGCKIHQTQPEPITEESRDNPEEEVSVGDRFGLLTVQGFQPEDEKEAICTCDCGNVKVTNVTTLKKGEAKSCGCIRSEIKARRYTPVKRHQSGTNRVYKEPEPGDRYGKWTVQEVYMRDANSKDSSNKVLCKCDCGNTRTIYARSLKEGKSKSCGCKSHKTRNKIEEEVGKKYNHLTVLDVLPPDSKDSSGGNRLLCQCDCGNVKSIRRGNVIQGQIKTCGCRMRKPKPSLSEPKPSKKYIGTYLKDGRWASAITHKKKRIWLGLFDTEEEAARAFDKKAFEIRGEDSNFNFPDEIFGSGKTEGFFSRFVKKIGFKK